MVTVYIMQVQYFATQTTGEKATQRTRVLVALLGLNTVCRCSAACTLSWHCMRVESATKESQQQ